MKYWRISISVGLVLAFLAVLAAFRMPSENVIGSYATSLRGRMGGQRHNAVLVALRLNGKCIEPGEMFSFNKTVGSWTRDQGYLKAPVSYNGQLIDSWGGGVCQTSTTLYNAALLSGLPILERHPHRFAPTYVPPGRDAAVAFSNIDLRFINPYSFPLHIHAKVRNNQIVVSITGKGKGTSTAIVQSIREVNFPREIVLKGSGFKKIRNSGKIGFEVETWRIIEGKRQWLASDSYPAMERIVQY